MIKSTLLTNWKTSLVGLFLMGAGLYSGLSAKQSWTECGPIIMAGIGLIFSKDAQRNTTEAMHNPVNLTQPND